MIVHKIPRVVALLSMVIGLMFIAGWYLGIDSLVSIRPSYWPAMKFISAMCFVLTGIIIFSIDRDVHRGDEFSPYLAALASLVITLFMTTILASKIFDISVGIEGLFVKEKYGAPKSVISGHPSLLSTVNFLLIAVSGFMLLVRPKKMTLLFSIVGSVICLSGLIAWAGYTLDLPYLYSYVPGISNGASLLSVSLFVFIGAALILIGLNHKNNTN